MFFVFLELINDKNYKTSTTVGKMFLMIKIGPGFIDSVVYSLIKLWWH
jgi:hypothetical protein